MYMNQQRSTTDFWDTRFAGAEYAYGEQPNQFLQQALGELSPEVAGRALCLAEGEGRNAAFLAELGYAVTAMDQSRVGLEKAQQLAAKRQVTLTTQQADLNDYVPPAESFDVVTMIWVHTPEAVRQKSYAIVKRGLKRGGYFILEGYLPAQATRDTGGPSNPDVMFTLQELQANFADFRFVVGRELTRNVEEGVYHTGVSDVLQVLAVRL
ncbi:class I SAM-dependent methyltransferase [Halomonas cibimaris]|uniref:Class I SAM-dependent methyltransferase n=2 Tax=Halomonas cibimaris TaxID=657012 RepID=A0ABP7LCF9_9GAMM